jgi:hypothetical protein
MTDAIGTIEVLPDPLGRRTHRLSAAGPRHAEEYVSGCSAGVAAPRSGSAASTAIT